MTLTPSGAQEQLLREHQLIFERAQIGIVVVRDRVIQRCNPRFEQIMGFEPGELTGKPTRVLYFSDEQWLDVGRRAYSAVAKTGSYTEEDIYRRCNGAPVCVHVTGSLINPDRPEEGYVWLYEDITEKRRNEDAMKTLLREQTLIFDRVQIGIVVLRNRVIQRCNPRFEEIFGYQPGELAGKSTRIYFPSDEAWEEMGRRSYSVVAEKGTFIGEDVYRRKDGTEVWCQVIGRAINPDNPDEGYVGLYDDVTERRRTADALKALLREQTMIFERAQIGIGVLNDRVIQRCNRRLEEIFGYAPGELLGRSTRILFSSEEAWASLGKRGYGAMAENGEFRAEQEYRRKDGSVVWCQFAIRPVNPDNLEEGHLVLFDDVTEQRRAEGALKALLREQTLIFERAHTGIMFLRDRVIQRCNPRFEEIFGHPPGTLVGQSTRALFPDEKAWTDAGVWIYSKLAESGIFDSDIHYVRGDGSPICCHVVGSLLDAENPATGSVWLYEDITARRATEEALRQSLREQNLMFDNAMIGIAYSRNRVIVRCNPRFEELLGYGPGELVGKSTRIYYASDEEWNAMGPRIGQADAERQTFEDEVSFCRRDGSPIWVHVIGRTVDTAEGRTWIWAYEDITARRKAEEALARNAREYALIFDNAMIGIAYQRNRIIVRCNRRLEEMFRHPPGSLIGQSTRVLFPTDAEWQETGRRVYEAAADRQTFDGETRYCRKDGTVIWCHIVGRLIDTDGDGQTWIWTYDDITARRAAETALAKNAREYALIFDNAMIGIAYMRDRVLLRCNRRFEEIFGFQPGGATGKTTRSMFASEEEFTEVGKRMLVAGAEGQGFSDEILYRRQDGAPIWVRINGQPLREGDGQVWIWTCQEVTRRHQAEEALRKSYSEMEQRVAERTAEVLEQLYFMEQLIEAIPGPVFYKDREGRHLGCNQRFADFLGKPRSELIGATVHDIGPEDLAGHARSIDEELFNNPGSRVYEAQVQTASGERLDVLVQKATFSSPGGSVGGLIGVMFDITERKRMEERMQQAATVFDSSVEGIVITAPDGSIIAVNRAYTEITGYSESEVLGRNSRILKSDRQDAEFYRDMWDTIARSGRWRGELWNKRKDGTLFPESLTISAVKDTVGRVLHYVGVFSDITELKRATALLDHQAHHDHLTGLPNRLLLEDRLHGAVLRAQREHTQVAVLFIDLDRFKNINDSLGHHVGDNVLRDVAQRFCALTRESDTVARLGGDEFLIVMEGIHDAGMASRVAEKILDDLRANPVTLEQEFFVGASIGISLFPQDGADAETLIKNADAAMYRAKERGRNAYEFSSDDLTQFSLDRFKMETDLRRAIERGELIVYLQPQFSLRTGALLGAEALVRWQHPQQGLVSPAKFIPLAEESGLIVALGEWVQNAACRCWADWELAGLHPGMLSINVSGVEFRRGQIQDTVRNALNATGLAPALLELEITEGAIMSQAENSIQVLHDLRAMGISLAIDDFGTGYSSLAYLKRLPLNKLKVDQSFVRGLPDDAEDCAIARAVIALGHSLQLKVIAEGVETEAQREFLIKADCDEMQGYLRGRPMPVEEFRREFLGA
jgi:diguanylate cyclase (GGDEF)-like protein/PAS domain S-box-containing protein